MGPHLIIRHCNLVRTHSLHFLRDLILAASVISVLSVTSVLILLQACGSTGFALAGNRGNTDQSEANRGNPRLLNAIQLQNNLQIPLTYFSSRVHSLHDANGITRLLVCHWNTTKGGRADHEPGVSWPRLRGSGFSKENHPLGALQNRGLACPGPIPSDPR